MKTIFVHNATILDCAILLPGEGPRGLSWHVDVFWKGIVADDGVLVDFGEAKKLAKQAIDNAFDHRLFVPKGCLLSNANQRFLVSTSWKVAGNPGVFALDIYENGIVAVDNSVLLSVANGDLAPLEKIIASVVKLASPGNVGEVLVRLRNPESSRSNFFSYTHSLRCHEGNCQRFHGHSNVIEVLREGIIDESLSAKAAQFLSGRYLVPQEYLRVNLDADRFAPLIDACRKHGVNSGDQVFIEYSGTQGPVLLSVPQSVLLSTPAESTIEAIADFVKSSLFAGMDVQVVAYEGLQKGAFSS